MARRPTNVTPFSRDYRRPPQWNMGLPPRRKRPTPLSDPRRWLKLVMAAAAFGLVVLPFGTDVVNAALNPVDPGGCRVISVIDGDTIRLLCPARGLVKARLKGFDTPEVFSPSCLQEWAAGMAATWHLRRLLFGARQVTAGFAGRDRYGRDLVSLTVDGSRVAGRMIADGYARPYDGGQRQGWCT